MIPPFDENGYLPPGLHPATLDEIRERFGCESELRRVQMESLEWLVDLARRVGALRLVINGSFTTDECEPNDVDCVLLLGERSQTDRGVISELKAGLPFMDIHVVGSTDFEDFVDQVFATDRFLVPKGVVEISL